MDHSMLIMMDHSENPKCVLH